MKIFFQHSFFRFFSTISMFYGMSLGVLHPVFADPQSSLKRIGAWDGMDHFFQLLENNGVNVSQVSTLNFSLISKNDGILILYPENELDFQAFDKFLKNGGRLAIVDDFGRSKNFLSLFGIQRKEEASPSTNSKDTKSITAKSGNDKPTIERVDVHIEHPLTQGIEFILTNHSARLSHSSLAALMRFHTNEGFGDSDGFAYIGAVEKGRLITMADSSVFINHMLSVEGNRRLATNLANYLTNHHENPLWVLSKKFEVISSPQNYPKDKSLFEALQIWKKVLSTPSSTSTTLQYLTLAFIWIPLFLLFFFLPKFSPYSRKKMTIKEK